MKSDIALDEIIEQASRLHQMIYRYQNGDGGPSLEVQNLTMLADDLREALCEHKETMELQ